MYMYEEEVYVCICMRKRSVYVYAGGRDPCMYMYEEEVYV